MSRENAENQSLAFGEFVFANMNGWADTSLPTRTLVHFLAASYS
jgi:hypothetical protein